MCVCVCVCVCIHIIFKILFSIMVHHKILNVVPGAIQYDLVAQVILLIPFILIKELSPDKIE